MMNNYYFADSIKVTICRSRLHIYETPFKATVFSLRILSVESTVSYGSTSLYKRYFKCKRAIAFIQHFAKIASVTFNKLE